MYCVTVFTYAQARVQTNKYQLFVFNSTNTCICHALIENILVLLNNAYVNVFKQKNVSFFFLPTP